MTYAFNNDKTKDEVYSKRENNFGNTTSWTFTTNGTNFTFPSDGYLHLIVGLNTSLSVELKGALDNKGVTLGQEVGGSAGTSKETLIYVKKGMRMTARVNYGNFAVGDFTPFKW